MDVARFLESVDLSESTVMGIDLRTCRKAFAPIRRAFGLTNRAVRLLSDPSANVKLSHSETDKVVAYGLNLLPADALQQKVDHAVAVMIGGVPTDALSLAVYQLIRAKWNTCRFSSPGCRAACLATSGQAGMEMRSGRDRLARARGAKLMFLLTHPAMFVRLLIHEIDGLPARAAAGLTKIGLDFADGWVVSLRLNVLSDLPWESFAPWVLARTTDAGIKAYDYTAWPTSKRSRDVATAAGLYLVDSVKETHSDAAIAAMARPVVVVNIPRGRDLPTTWRGRPSHDADRSDARFMDVPGSVSLLRYKHVATCTAAMALSSGFVKVA